MTVRTPDEYRADAPRLREQGQQADREDVRKTLLDLARLYEKMAEQVEKLEKQRASKG
jgi:hypothetical protein